MAYQEKWGMASCHWKKASSSLNEERAYSENLRENICNGGPSRHQEEQKIIRVRLTVIPPDAHIWACPVPSGDEKHGVAGQDPWQSEAYREGLEMQR